nr:helix-turn-helix transcriptional regulator [Devosia faecipullorum]
MVASLFGLTEAERRVFGLIASGQAVEETARRLGVAESTIRTHLLRIFAKTNCGRQAELVALAAAFRPMVRH